MALSCLRSKLCKICLLFFLVALAVVAIVLWHRAVQDGAVEFLVPVHRMDGMCVCVCVSVCACMCACVRVRAQNGWYVCVCV